MGDFFGVAHGRTAHYSSTYLGTPEGRGFQCYFPMPFTRRCRITFENDSPVEMPWLFYQVDYTLGDIVTEDMGRFHTHFRRENPCPLLQDYQLLSTDGSPGVFVGAVLGVNPLGPGWWGEGEMKFYIEGDTDYPTICRTGLEDYICTGWGLGLHSAQYTGVNYLARDTNHKAQFASFYRFHVLDPIYFQSDLRVEIQQLGAGTPYPEEVNRANLEEKQNYLKSLGFSGPHIHPDVENPGAIMSNWLYERSDDYCSTVYWYQKTQKKPLPPLPDREKRIAGISKQPWEKG